VDDKRDVKVACLAKGLTNHDLVDAKWISNKYGIPGDRYALFAMIRGDSSDGLPGLKGIGEKGAALLANSYPDIGAVVEAAKNGDPQLKPALIKKILESADYAQIAPTLVHCALDVPVPKINHELKSTKINFALVEKMQEQFGLGASVDRLISAIENR